ncbi:MAG TPA: SRPBCC family protein [Planctomycetota bacterium]|nr:SRPBCC family protein [Planctomycetota bacterium]
MKFVFALVLLVLVSYLVGFFLPQTYEVSRSVVIDAPMADIHAKVDDLHTWIVWSDFKPPADTETESTYEGPEKGPGSAWHWGGLGDIKPAKLTILTSHPDHGITYSLDMDGGRVQTTGDVRYEATPEGVRVTISNKGELPTPWSRYFAFLADKSIGPTFERSLQGLKQAVEATEPKLDPALQPKDGTPPAAEPQPGEQ